MRLELLHERQVALALLRKVVNILIDGIQRLEVQLAHDRIKVDDLIQGALVVQLWQQCQVFVDVRHWSQKQFQLLRLKQIRATHELLEEHVEVEAALFDELLLEPIHLALTRNRWHIETNVPLVQLIMQQIELAISSLNLKGPIMIFTDDRVDNMAAFRRALRIANTERLRKFVRGYWLVDRQLAHVAFDVAVLNNSLRHDRSSPVWLRRSLVIRRHDSIADALGSDRRSMLTNLIVNSHVTPHLPVRALLKILSLSTAMLRVKVIITIINILSLDKVIRVL